MYYAADGTYDRDGLEEADGGEGISRDRCNQRFERKCQQGRHGEGECETSDQPAALLGSVCQFVHALEFITQGRMVDGKKNARVSFFCEITIAFAEQQLVIESEHAAPPAALRKPGCASQRG